MYAFVVIVQKNYQNGDLYDLRLKREVNGIKGYLPNTKNEHTVCLLKHYALA